MFTDLEPINKTIRSGGDMQNKYSNMTRPARKHMYASESKMRVFAGLANNFLYARAESQCFSSEWLACLI